MRDYDYDFYHENRFGSAQWADEKSLKRAGHFKASGLQLGYFNQKPLYVDSDGGIITIAGARSGKGRDVLTYNICKYKGSMLINDPRGELYAIMHQTQHRLRIKAYAFNPMNMLNLPSHRCNILDILTPKSPDLHTDVKVVVENFITVSKNEPHFDLRAQEWLEQIILTIVRTKESITLVDVYDAVNWIEGDSQKFYDKVLIPMKESSAKGASIAYEMHKKSEKAPKEFTAIMGSLFNAFKWMQPAYRDMLSGGDFSLGQLADKRNKSKIAIMFPAEAISATAPLIRLIFTVGMLYKQRRPKVGRVVYLIDEAGQLGYFPELEKALTFGAGAGVRAWPVFQDIGQIRKNFGDHAVTTFLGSAQTRQWFGVRDYDTAAMLSGMLGSQTLPFDDKQQQRQAAQARYGAAVQLMSGDISNAYDAMHGAANMHHQQKQGRSMMTPDEILNMPPDRQILMLSGMENGAALAHKYPYYTRREMAGAYMPNPYHKPHNFVKVKGGLLFGYAPVIRWFKPLLKRSWPQFQKGRKIIVRTWI